MSYIEYEKLFEPYTADGHTFESAVAYLNKLCAADVVQIAVDEIFTGLAQGDEYSKTGCTCGCGSEKAGTDLVHAIRDRMYAIDKQKTKAANKSMQNRLDQLLEQEMLKISKTNKEYIKMNRPPIYQRSPVLRIIIKLWIILRLLH